MASYIVEQRLYRRKEKLLVQSSSPLSRFGAGPRWLGTPPPFSTISYARERNISPSGPSTNFRRTFPVSLFAKSSFFFLFPPFSLSPEIIVQTEIKGKRVGASVRSSWRSQCIQRHGVVVIAPPLTSLPAPSSLLSRCRIDK